MARWLLTFRAIDPNALDKRWDTGVPERLYRQIQHHGHEKALARLVLVQEVLERDTHSLYGGWSRPDKEDCFVYVGCPNRDFKSLTIETPPPPGMGFLVFVLPDGTIDEWTWRQFDEEGGNRPSGVTGELIWSLNPS
ncbi:MAG: hypothetical protein ACYTG0_01780 [Planctomycetota bacterium]|jgi:hypothetical protein